MPLTGPLKCLTGEIWQADVSGHLRDTAREKKSVTSDLGDSHANTFWRRQPAEPPGEPHKFTVDVHMFHARKEK